MGKIRSHLHFPNVFRGFLDTLESVRNRTCVSDTIQRRDNESWDELGRTLFFNPENIQKRLLRLERTKLLGRLDEEIQGHVRKTNIMTDKIEKTREEIYASSSFEWIKTERSGDVCKFKQIKEENGVEYMIFTDNTRIKVELIGDVVLMHSDGEEPLTSNAFEMAGAPTTLVQRVQQPVAKIPIENPIHSLLKKAKLEENNVLMPITMMLPTVDFYHIVADNFENGDEEIVSFLRSQITEDMIVSALKHALLDKYTK